MPDYNRELLDLARRNAARYADDPNVRAILVTGSVATGLADANSDIDLILYLSEPATQAFFDEELALAKANDGALYAGTAKEGFGLYRYVEGVKCDFGFGAAADTDELIADVLEKTDLELTKQQIISGIRDAVPLHGENLINEWVRRTNDYPDALRNAMVMKHIRITPIWNLRTMGAERNDHLFVYESYTETVKRLLGVLYGLNRVYHPNKLKGAGRLIRSLRIAPEDLHPCIEGLYTSPLDEGVDHLERLVEEVFTLVDRHCPSVDTEPARGFFRVTCVKR